MNNHQRNILYYTPAIGWGILILYFSLLPGPQVPPLLKSIEDLFLHFGIYALFTAFIGLGKIQFTKIKIDKVFTGRVILFAVCLGGAIELIQEHLILNRTAGWDDFFANTVGAIFGMVVVHFWASR